MKPSICLVLVSLLMLQAACSSSRNSSPQAPQAPPGPAAPQEVIVTPFEADDVGMPVVKTIDFGTVIEAMTKTFKITNPYETNIYFSENNGSAYISGQTSETSQEALLATSDCPLTLAPGSTCEVTFTINPSLIQSTNFLGAIGGFFEEFPEGYAFYSNGFFVQIKANLPGKDEMVTGSVAGEINADFDNYPQLRTQSLAFPPSEGGVLKNVVITIPEGFEMVLSTCSSVIFPTIGCILYTKHSGPSNQYDSATITLTAKDGLGNQLSESYVIPALIEE